MELADTQHDLMVPDGWPGYPSADRNPALSYLAGLANARARVVQRQALDKIAELVTGESGQAITFPWHGLRYQHVRAIRAQLAERYSPATANRMLAALRRAVKECWRLGYMTADEMARACDVANVKGERLPAGRGLTSAEIRALMSDCAADPTPAGARDAAMIAVLYQGGVRRAEIVSIALADYDPTSGGIRITGKGRKDREVYITNGATQAMAAWLAMRGYDDGPLFCRINKAFEITGKGLTGQAVYNMLRKRAKLAGVKDFSPHDLRRSFVSDLLDAGADIATVAKMAGHASVNTTGRYDRRPEEAKQKAAALLHVPYGR